METILQIVSGPEVSVTALRDLLAPFNLSEPISKPEELRVLIDNDNAVAIARRVEHPDWREIQQLSVLPEYRKRGFGQQLVLKLMAKAKHPLYLQTIIPDFFAKLGFRPTTDYPPELVKPDWWCAGCDKALCTVMVYNRQIAETGIPITNYE